jgi:hypothetical protein
MMTISRDVLLKELETAREYLDKWITKVNEGIPGIDIPAAGDAEEHIDVFVRELCGELRIISGKCDNLAEVVIDTILQG